MASPAEKTEHTAPLRPDDTPPRNRVIFTYTLLAVITLYGLEWVFESYIDTSRTALRASHVAGSHTSEVLVEYRDTQSERLASGPMPIERAIEELGRRGRAGFPQIRPQPSDDLDPLRGWAQLPRELPPGLVPEEPAPPPEVLIPAPVIDVPVPVDGAPAGAAAVPPPPVEAAPAEVVPPPAEPAVAPTPRPVRPPRAPRPAAPPEGAPAEAAPADPAPAAATPTP